jgi:hypothetical protein
VKKFVLAPCLLAVLAPAWGQTPGEKKATVAYLHKLQNKDGAFRPTAAEAPSSLRATSAALRALKYFGGEVKHKDRCAAFVQSCFDKARGGFADRPGGKPDVVVTAVGLMALVELKGPVADYEKPAVAFLAKNAKAFEEVRMAAAGLEALGKRSPRNEAWLAELAKKQNADGTFGKDGALPRETGGAVAAVLRLGGKIESPAAVRKALDAGQGRDGGFGKAGAKGSDLETTYRVVRTYVMLKARPARAADCRAFVASCRNADGGYGVAPGQPSTVGGTYFASIVLHWLAEK